MRVRARVVYRHAHMFSIHSCPNHRLNHRLDLNQARVAMADLETPSAEVPRAAGASASPSNASASDDEKQDPKMPHSPPGQLRSKRRGWTVPVMPCLPCCSVD